MGGLADWGPITTDSALPGYTGPSSDTLVDQGDPSKYFTTGYYADQIAQFQATLIQLDQTAQILTNLRASPDLDPTDADVIDAWLADYNGKKVEFQAAAATINAVTKAANTFGVGLPQISLPTTLQLAPVAIVGIAAAVAVVASLIAWATEKISTARQITAQLQSLPPDQRAAALQQIEAANPSTIGQVALIVKWIAVGALIWFGYKAWDEYRGPSSGRMH